MRTRIPRANPCVIRTTGLMMTKRSYSFQRIPYPAEGTINTQRIQKRQSQARTNGMNNVVSCRMRLWSQNTVFNCLAVRACTRLWWVQRQTFRTLTSTIQATHKHSILESEGGAGGRGKEMDTQRRNTERNPQSKQ